MITRGFNPDELARLMLMMAAEVGKGVFFIENVEASRSY